MQAKKLIGITVATLCALAVLLGLGVWQLERLQWKEGLIAAIESRTKGPPVSLDEALALAAKGEDIEYLRIKLRGRFDHDDAVFRGRSRHGRGLSPITVSPPRASRRAPESSVAKKRMS